MPGAWGWGWAGLRVPILRAAAAVEGIRAGTRLPQSSNPESWPPAGAGRTGLCVEPRAPGGGVGGGCGRKGAVPAPPLASYPLPNPTEKSSLRGLQTSSLETRRPCVSAEGCGEAPPGGLRAPFPPNSSTRWARGFLVDSWVSPAATLGAGGTARAWGLGALGTRAAPARRSGGAVGSTQRLR